MDRQGLATKTRFDVRCRRNGSIGVLSGLATIVNMYKLSILFPLLLLQTHIGAGYTASEQEDDDSFDTLPCGPLGQDILVWKDEDVALSGTGEFVALSPTDGRKFANGYHIEDPSLNIRAGFRVRTWVYADYLSRWVEGVDPIQVDYEMDYHNDDDLDEGLFSTNNLRMTRHLLAVGTSETVMDVVGTVLDSDGFIQIWSWAGSNGQGRQSMGWLPYATLSLPFPEGNIDGQEEEKDDRGRKSSPTGFLTYGRIFDMVETNSYDPRVAVGMPAVEDWSSSMEDRANGKVAVYDFYTYEDVRPAHWQQVGQVLEGDNQPGFGQEVLLSRDGSILAVLVLTTTRSHIPMQCEARVYKLDASTNNWNDFGNPIAAADDEGDNMICSNMILSGDGRTLGLGPKEYSFKYDDQPAGHVRMWTYNEGVWERKGSDIDTIIRLPDDRSYLFGRDMSLSMDGNRLIVSAAQSLLKKSSPTFGIIYVLEWKEEKRDWEQYGWPLETLEVGGTQRSSLSDDGETLVVGIPDGADHRGVVQPYDCFGYGASIE